ncbi:MAG: cache domain-containing protein [Pseudomonadota bacterium]
MFKTIMAALVFAATAVGFASAADRGSREEAVAMLERAEAIYDAQGIDAVVEAVMDQSNSDFHDRDLYVFVFELGGATVAHGAKPALVGKDLTGLRDQDGHQFVKSMLEIAARGETGWVDYKWPNPTTNVVEAKSSYVIPLGDGYAAGVGVYAE